MRKEQKAQAWRWDSDMLISNPGNTGTAVKILYWAYLQDMALSGSAHFQNVYHHTARAWSSGPPHFQGMIHSGPPHF